MDKKRDGSVDSLKGFLIILVVLGHIIGGLKIHGGGYIWNLIYTFHMPLFVLVSGYFSKRDNPNVLVLLKPLIVFQILNVIILSILGHSFSLSYLIIPHWTLWYLLSLIFWRGILKYVPKSLLSRPYLFIGTTITIAIVSGLFIPYGRILSIQRTINFLPFFLLGYYFKTNSVPQKLWNNKLSMILLVTICFIVFAGCYPHNADVLLKGADSYHIQDLPSKFFLFLCTIVCIYSIWNIKTEITILSKIGKDSLFYYLYHGLIIEFLISPFVARFALPTGLLSAVIYMLFVFLILTILNRIYFFKWLINPVLFSKY